MTIWRLAAASAFDFRQRDGLLRLCGVIAATCVATMTAFLALSTLQSAERAEARQSARLGQLANGGGPHDVIMQESDFTWNGKTVTVVALEPLGDSPVGPPGLDSVPPAGTSAVSPNLARLTAMDPVLASRLHVSGAIAPDGLTDPDELLAYIGVPKGTFADDDPIREVGGQYSGVGPMAIVEGFGSGPALPIAVAMGRELPHSIELRSFAFALLLAALVLLVVALGLASPARNRRLALLDALGVKTTRRATLLACEAVLLTAPPAGIAALLGQWTARRLDRLPLTGRAAFPGDGVLPWGQVALLIGVTLLVAALFSALLAARSVGGSTLRPTSRRERVWGVGWFVLGASALAFREALVRGGEIDATFYLIGSFLAILGAPIAVGPLLRTVGRWLHRSRSVSVSVAGASMDREPLRAGRPFLSLVALVVLSAVAGGYLLLARTTEGTPAERAGLHAIQVAWRGSDLPSELANLEKALPSGLVMPVYSDHENPGDVLTLGGTCQDLQRVDVGTRCDSQGNVAGPIVALLAREVMLGQPEARVQLSTEDPEARKGRVDVLVLGYGDLVALTQGVQGAALEALPFSQVTSASDSDPRVSPLVQWIQAGMVGALFACAFACLLALVDRFRRTSGVTPVLQLLGVGPAAEGRLRAVGFAAPYIAGTGLALAVGTSATVLVSSAAGTPWSSLRWIALFVTGIGLLGTCLVALPAGLVVRARD